MVVEKKRGTVRERPPVPAQRERPTLVTRPVLANLAALLRLNWRTVGAGTDGRAQGTSATLATRGGLRCGF